MSVGEHEAMISTNNDTEGPDAAAVLDCEESPIIRGGMTTVPTALDPNDNDNDLEIRRGTIPSARFNILSTMVGGGCLSLPLAFQKSGNGLLGPLILLVVAIITDFCFRLLVDTANIISGTPDMYRPGKDSFESITSVAFGAKVYVFSMGLVTAMCFFGAVGYSVLLRDMMEPINDMIQGNSDHDDSSWLHKNLTMFAVVFIVTPACTLSSFTALKNCGAASMCSILVLGSCIVYRSIQCNMTAEHPWYTYVTFLPESPKDVLDAAPLFISCFVCHYNILPVHNELQQPTPQRVSWWLRSTTWFAAILYMIIAFAGSAFGHCTATGQVQGNVLLDFNEHDPLLMVGRMCLAMTITLAFPLLVIPARDILLRSLIIPCLVKKNQGNSDVPSNVEVSLAEQLQEPLLGNDELDPAMEANAATAVTAPPQASFLLRLITAIGILWTSAAVASCVESIDIVWDLLGSSLSILLSYLIPCGCYLAVTRNNPTVTAGSLPRSTSRFLAWSLILFFTPLMFVSTGNAIANTFLA